MEFLDVDWFEEVVGGVEFESVEGIFGEGGGEYDFRSVVGFDALHESESGHARHLYVAENELDVAFGDAVVCVVRVCASAGELEVVGIFDVFGH